MIMINKSALLSFFLFLLLSVNSGRAANFLLDGYVIVEESLHPMTDHPVEIRSESGTLITFTFTNQDGFSHLDGMTPLIPLGLDPGIESGLGFFE